MRGGFAAASIGLIVANGLAMLIGFTAKALHDEVDRVVYDRLDEMGTNWLTTVLETVTKMGNERQTQLLAVGGAIALAVWFARQRWRWWVPLVAMPTAWIGARGFQLIQTRVIDRDRGVPSLIGDEIGGYPSGGVARIILISGLLVFLVVHYAGVPRRIARWMYAGVGLLGFVEAIARLRLNQHWCTDVIGGACFGGMLLGVAMTTIRVFDPNHPTLPRRP